ncbi:efflux RND transporter periplasmic adaptor subunit [Variovorax ginsengisoli]|uniref:Membrane fusion protein (Multidrug efflux system) n=1 Tax=Variovorax ginsengisoli TaxID=363844 RepID=A0ABT9SC00_9BURK|nr:efflux RND transporter periplasmic adaptor subunit [Variovorax ginsengisoli]MDP9900892.1 membrane fusion protein (multidrug efflux system) [Variovorax ginsengisoli]
MTACNQQDKPPQRGPVEVGITTLQTQAVALTTELAGRTTASLSSDVRPQVAGIIKARRFEEGSLVRAGQVLYQIDPASYQATVDQYVASLANAQASVSSAKLKSERYDDLLKIEGVAKQDADDARTSYQQAVATVAQQKASLASARINLEYTQVRAPISGRIGKSSVTPGALVTASQTDALATIRALDPIYVDVTQSSASLLRLRRLLASAQGMQAGSTEVGLKLEDGSDYARKGRLKFSEVAVDEATGSVTLRAEFPNPDGTLLPGMYVRAVVDEAVDPQGLLVPQQGISRDAKGDATAMVVGNDNKVRSVTVTTQRSIGDKWLVSSGLAAGDRVVVQGNNKIKDGDTVKPVDAQSASGSSDAAPRSQGAQPAPAAGGR